MLPRAVRLSPNLVPQVKITGKRFSNQALTIYVLKNFKKQALWHVEVPKKSYTKATERHRIKRLLHEQLKTINRQKPSGGTCVVRVKQLPPNTTPSDIKTALFPLLTLAGFI